jgi:glycosyltransferase involved in cell wall biosynthesis
VASLKNIRVAFFLPSLGGGGAQRVIVNLANYYVRQGIAVDLLLVKNQGAYFPLLDSRVNLVILGCSRVAFSLIYLLRYLKKARPNSLLVTMPHVSIVAILAKLICGLSFKLIIRQPNYLSLNTGKINYFTRLLVKLICLLFNRADSIIAISQGVAKDLNSYGVIDSDKISVIYNPIFSGSILNQAEQKIQHQWISNGHRDYALIIAVGRLVRQKNFSMLIDAFHKLLRQQNARLIILGEGPLKSELQAKINSLGLSWCIELLGFSDNPYAYLKRADVFVLSSLWEGFGNVLVESLALGTPVVSTDCPSGPAEILQDGKYGILVENNNSDALAAGMLKALRQSLQKEELIHRAKYFSISNIAEQYKQIIFNAGEINGRA